MFARSVARLLRARPTLASGARRLFTRSITTSAPRSSSFRVALLVGSGLASAAAAGFGFALQLQQAGVAHCASSNNAKHDDDGDDYHKHAVATKSQS